MISEQVKSFLAYSMLMMIVGGVGLACVKEGKGVEVNMAAFGWASFANLAGVNLNPQPFTNQAGVEAAARTHSCSSL